MDPWIRVVYLVGSNQEFYSGLIPFGHTFWACAICSLYFLLLSSGFTYTTPQANNCNRKLPCAVVSAIETLYLRTCFIFGAKVIDSHLIQQKTVRKSSAFSLDLNGHTLEVSSTVLKAETQHNA